MSDSAQKPSPLANPSPKSTISPTAIAVWAFASIGVGLILTLFVGCLADEGRWWPAFGICALSGLASLGLGWFAGFLFGIPRVLQGTNAETDGIKKVGARYEQRVNTNLEQISDWLTKILVGVGLVEMKDAPGFVWNVARHLSQSFSKEGAPSPAATPGMCVTITFFGVLGFVFGYLVTRLFLAKLFREADQNSTSPVAGIDTGEATGEEIPRDVPSTLDANTDQKPEFQAEAKRILATLKKYQKVHCGNDSMKRWTFAITPASPNFPTYVKGLSSLLEHGLVAVSPETNQVMLSGKGLQYVESDSTLDGLDTYF